MGASPEVADPEGLLHRPGRPSGWRPATERSVGGSCRLVAVADGWVAVNLPRPDDLDLLPAWVGLEPGTATSTGGAVVPWAELAVALASWSAAGVVERGQELGLAVAALPTAADEPDAQLRARGTEDPSRPFVVTRAGPRRSAALSADELVVVDLSSLWAGPLCSWLLTRIGAQVTKVESTTRPDGARRGMAELYRWLHAGQASRSLPLATPAGWAQLREVLATADVVIEGSRPRALERMGIEPTEVVAARPGVVWVSITAYGRTGPWRNRVGFGDDAAAAGGLVTWHADRPSFVGDAIADPLTGLVAGAAAVGGAAGGGGVIVDVALREVARAAASGAPVAW